MLRAVEQLMLVLEHVKSKNRSSGEEYSGEEPGGSKPLPMMSSVELLRVRRS
jgi:hypothetical protein